GLAMQDAIRVADQFDVVAFQQQAKKLVETKDFSDEATKVLKTYNTKMNISREKLLKQQLDLIVKRSGIDIEHKIEDKLVDAVDREVERQAGI
ncbi:phage head morphogenesis protein, partial [Staphylococcus epidermidis]